VATNNSQEPTNEITSEVVEREVDTYYIACPGCNQKGMVEFEKDVKPDKCPTCNYEGIFIRCL